MKHTMQTPTMHKAMIAVAAAGLFSLGTSAAFAQQAPQSADMTVTGTIVPAACSVDFEGGGVFDFGRARLIDLPANAHYRMGTKTMSLNVTCASKKRVMVRVLDMQPDSRIVGAEMRTATGASVDGQIFGLGMATVGSGSTSLGSYSLTVSAPKIDGASSALVYTIDNGASWRASLGLMSYNDGAFVTGATGTTPITGTRFVFPVTVQVALNYGSRLQVAQDTPFNGQTTIAINYQ